MIVAVMPATGVGWSEPSRRGRSYAPESAASDIRAWSRSFEIAFRRRRCPRSPPEGGRQGLRRLELAGLLEGEARERAEVGVARRVDEDPGGNADEARLGGHDHLLDVAVADDDVLEERVEEDADPRRRSRGSPRRP